MRNNDMEFEYCTEEQGFVYVNEGRLEEQVMGALDLHVSDNELFDTVDEDVYLAVTNRREGLISWYPFEGTETVLEIGAGFGELTKYLSDNVKYVVAYEFKPERKRIIQYRCKGNDNLKIVTGDLKKADFGHQFDMILIHDILAFSRKFFKGEEPSVSFLEYIKRFLKPTGRMLLSVENRIGLRYFSGAAEDYSRCFFYGVNEFEQDERFRTYSREELKNLFSTCGLYDKEWYYPFPNAILPEEIFHEDIDEKIFYGVTSQEQGLDGSRYLFFDEKRMFMTLHREGIAYQFANAFLVECELEETVKNQEIVVYSNLREKTQIVKRKDGKMYTSKGELLPEGIRSDVFLASIIKEVVDCNMGNDNPFIQKFSSLLEGVCREMEKKHISMRDVYVNGLEISSVSEKELTKEERIAELYSFYLEHISHYRNAFRRLKIEIFWKALGLNDDEVEAFLNTYKKDTISKLSYPSMMFDFEAGANANSVFYEESNKEPLGLKLKNLHGGLFD